MFSELPRDIREMQELVHGPLVVHRETGIITVEDHPVCNTVTTSLTKQRLDISQKEDSEQLNVSDRLVRSELFEQYLRGSCISRAINTAPRWDSGHIDGFFGSADVFHRASWVT
jgi:hypothetical protein